MKKYVPSIIMAGLIAVGIIAGQLSYTTAQVDSAVAIALGDTTNATIYASSIVFTNGWSIDSVSTGLVFNAP